MAEKPDRRVARTRRLLKDALLELIMEQGYDSITVQDILDRAEVARSTFYAHFDSKDDLLLGDGPYLRFDFSDVEYTDLENEIIPSYLDVFQHVAEQSALFKALMGGQGLELVQRVVDRHFYAGFVHRFERLEEQGRVLPVPAKVMAHYMTGGLMALITWWLNEDMPYSPEEINEMFLHMARSAFAQFNEESQLE